MVQLGTSESRTDTGVNWSPDGRKFIILMHGGDLEKNTNNYSLVLFRSGHRFRPQVLFVWTSSSNNPAISNVRWLADNETVAFLGERPGRKQQIYCLNVRTRALRQLTQHPTDIVAFDTTADMRMIAYLARPPVVKLIDEISKTRGVVVSDQQLADLLVGHGQVNKWALFRLQLFVMRDRKHTAAIRFRDPETPIPQAGVTLSPDGRFAVIMTNTRLYTTPDSWKRYRMLSGGNQNVFLTYCIINIHTQSVKRLLSAPISAAEGTVWSSDGKSIVIGSTYLPLNVEDPDEREARETSTWAVEVQATTGDFTKIAKGSFSVLKWQSNTNSVVLKALYSATFNSIDSYKDQSPIVYRKIEGRWERTEFTTVAARPLLEVRVEQGINTPPRLFGLDPGSGKRSLLMDPNPQFRGIRFGQVEEITWEARDGVQYKGGLYLPPDYGQGKKYPIVIQTHGWDPRDFSIDGWSTAGYAAQALAGKGFIVAQVPIAKELSTTKEGSQNMAMLEGLIDSLDGRGMINRRHVGLLGWSRTGYHVRYTLAFSKYSFGAAVLADGMDGGYWQYIAEANSSPSDTYDGQNGAAPFTDGLQRWFTLVPSFNLDKVRTPVRELGFGQYWFEYNWEWFVGLKRLGKPVELIWLPDALHAPVKPLERMVAQQGNVDWFCFWLKGEEDPDPAKADQYARWRELRTLQNSVEETMWPESK